MLEVLISTVLLSMTVVGIALMFSTGQAYVHGGADDRTALYLAQQTIEELRAGGFTSLPVTDAAATGGPTPCPGCPETLILNPANSDTAAASTFSRSWAITCVSETNLTTRIACSSPDVAKMIEVTVTRQANPKARGSDPSNPSWRPVVMRTVVFNRCFANSVALATDNEKECS